ncbi:MAG: ankyrin repeat domain-containing protein [Alphaproteobacteria bacterium]
MNIAEEFKEAVKYAWESAPVRMVENGSEKSLKALKAYVKMHPGVIDNQLEKYHGYTLLHVACARGNFGAAKILIEHGADFKQTTASGATPLALAVLWCDDDTSPWEERKKLASLLLSKGADIEARFGDDKRTILQEAFSQQQEKEARFLLDKGADPLAAVESRNKMTPLMNCLENFGNENLMDLGIAKGMDVNAVNGFGMTPLFYAHTAVQALKLIEAGADPAHVDNNGRSALSLLPPDEEKTVRLIMTRDAEIKTAQTRMKKAQAVAEIDSACHTPFEAETMKTLKIKKGKGQKWTP